LGNAGAERSVQGKGRCKKDLMDSRIGGQVLGQVDKIMITKCHQGLDFQLLYGISAGERDEIIEILLQPSTISLVNTAKVVTMVQALQKTISRRCYV
jgi:hypothetical protein